MKNVRKGVLCLLGLASTLSFAQSGEPVYVEQMQNSTVNFYTVQKSFEDYWAGKEVERSHGWKQFKRWEAFMEPRVYPSGERPDPTVLWTEMQAVSAAASSSTLGNWTQIGPLNGNTLQGIGRVNCIAFHPTQPNTVFVGAPAGGVWKSTNGGNSWNTNTDLLPNLGVSAIAIDPIHPDTMYIATGDRDAADTYSIGLLKSTDGGQTWNTTGMSYSVTMSQRIGGIYINPKNTEQIVVASRSGIYRSTNGGASFSTVSTGSWQNLNFIPGASDTLLAGSNSSARVARSVDAGQTWTAVTSGLPTNVGSRVELATTADDNSYVYAVVSASNNGLYGVYRSTDGGASFTQVFSGNTSNLLSWGTSPGPNSGSSAGGQGWYDLAIAVSPLNKNEVYVGGVNIWRSTTGGSSWSLSAHWYGGGGAAFAHADQHYFKYKPGTSTLYAGNDGGVYKTSDGTTYTSLCDGLGITQYYRIDVSEGNQALTIAGAQDNGNHLENSFGWSRVKGGDGMDNAIAETNPNIMYAASQYGNFSKSNNGGQSFNAPFNLPPNGQGQWITPIVIDPTNDNVVYIGFDQLWKSTNAGVSFSATSTYIDGMQQWIDAIAVAPSNPSYIYVSIESKVYKSTNGGTSWTLISGPLTSNRKVTDIAVSDTDPNHIWITKSGYSNSDKVYTSSNAGIVWTNISANLPNLPINTIIYQNGSNDGIYVGTDIGVYFIDNSSTTWTSFMNGLPNVIVNDLEIHYGEGVIRAGTYGRGVWESPLVGNFFDRPAAEFEVSPSAICNLSDTVTLTDLSTYVPTSWTWTIAPSTYTFVNGTNAHSQNPQVLFSANGQYSVQLIAENRFGSDTAVQIGAIGVGGKALPYLEDFALGIPEDFEIVNPDNGTTWSASPAGNGSAFMDFYNYNSQGAIDEMILPPFDFTGMANTTMHYDVAYRAYSSAYKDSLKIYVSTNCGSTWTLVDSRGEDGTGNFATGSNQTSLFTPQSSSDWRTDSLDLSAYDNLDEVRIKFVGLNGYGNNLYLDNINISASIGAAPVADFFATDTACLGSTVQYYNLSGMNGQSYQWTFPGGTPSTSTLPNPSITYNTAGAHSVSLVVSNTLGSDSIYKSNKIYVGSSVSPSVSIASMSSSICAGEDVSFYATGVNLGSNPRFEWYVNGQLQSGTGDSTTLVNLQNNDTVRVVLYSSIPCANPAWVTSNTIVASVLPLPVVNAGNYGTTCINDAPFSLTGTPAGGTYSGRGVSGNMFDPSQAGVGQHSITYSYTDANGCSNSSTVSIQVQNGPNVFLNVRKYCENDPQENMNYGYPAGGTYTLDGVVTTTLNPSNLGPGKYFIQYSYSNGTCTSVKSDTIVVLAAPPANPGVTVTWGSLTCNVVGYDYQWLDATGAPIPGETGRVFYPQTPGDYAVRVSAGTNCSETSDMVYIENVSLEDQFIASLGLKIFPNPASTTATVSFNLSERKAVSIQVMDLSGKMLQQFDGGDLMGEIQIPMELGHLARGVYMLKITLGDVSTTQRIALE